MKTPAIAVRTQYLPKPRRGLHSCHSRIISGSAMSRVLNYVPRVALFLAGEAAAAITLSRRERGGMDAGTTEELTRALTGPNARLQARETADAARLDRVEIRLEEPAAKLADVPS